MTARRYVALAVAAPLLLTLGSLGDASAARLPVSAEPLQVWTLRVDLPAPEPEVEPEVESDNQAVEAEPQQPAPAAPDAAPAPVAEEPEPTPAEPAPSVEAPAPAEETTPSEAAPPPEASAPSTSDPAADLPDWPAGPTCRTGLPDATQAPRDLHASFTTPYAAPVTVGSWHDAP